MTTKFTKIISLFMVLILSMTLCISFAFAEDGDGGSTPTSDSGTRATAVKPSDNDKAKVYINNVESTATVKAYRVLKPTFGDFGLLGYETELTGGTYISDYEKPTQADILKMAQMARDGQFDSALKYTFTNVEGTETFEANVQAGSYIILITDKTDATWVYNPMYISVYYLDANDGNQLSAGQVDASGNFVINSATYYAKRSKINLEKTIQTENKKSTKYDDYQLGDTAKFRVETVTPLYDRIYTNVKFWLLDNQSKGLDTATDFTVQSSKDGNTWTTIPETNYTLVNGVNATDVDYTIANGFDGATADSGNDWAIAFDGEWVIANIGTRIRVEYNAVINEDSILTDKTNPNGANPNDVELEFTNDVYGHESHLYDEVRYYTFKIDQAIKVDEYDNTLGGASFAIVKANTGNDDLLDKDKWFATCTTDDDGVIHFEHLDQGMYYMKEYDAPDNHFINETRYTIQIDAEYDDVTNEIVGHTVTITGGGGEAVSTIQRDVPNAIEYTYIVDPILSELPSTGGIGTVIFTIIGCLVVLGAMGGVLLYIRRKRIKEES